MWNPRISGTARLPGARPTEPQLLNVLREALRARLPAAWRIELAPEVARAGRRLGALLTITDPNGASGRIMVAVRRSLTPKDALLLIVQLRVGTPTNEQSLVLAPFLGPRTRQLLAEAGASYADATGNLRLAMDAPALYVESSGADTDPWKEPQSGLRSLKGPAAGRVVRALCDFRPPFGILELAQRSGTPASSVSRVVALLEREALLTRDAMGAVTEVKWRELIERWTRDYGLLTSNTVSTYLEPRGLDALLRKLPAAAWPYAVTGSLAAARVAPLAPPRLATVYVRSTDTAAADLALRPAERGANVLLIEPFDAVVFDRTSEGDGAAYAALSQAAADLLTGPGRGPEEGQGLLVWMEENEDAWRR